MDTKNDLAKYSDKEMTAVEWLVRGLIEKVIELDEYPYEEEATKLIEQAKAMGKQQIIDAYDKGFIESCAFDRGAEQFYNRTYKS